MSDKKIKKEMIADQNEANRKKIVKNYRDYCESHNKRPMSRRDLLSAGVFGFTASLTLPTLMGMMVPRVAKAQTMNCPSASSGASMAPFVTLNLAGGAGLASNYVPTDAGGQLLPTYNKLGLGNSSLNIENEFGNVPFAGDDGTGVLISKLLTELRNNATPATLANTAFVAIPVRSRDDSSMNPFDATGMVSSAGLIGSDLPNLGKSSTDTGIRQMYAKIKPPTPLVVGNYDDIASALALGATGPLANLNDEQKVSLVKLVNNLSDSQVQKVNSNAGGRMLANLTRCSTTKNVELSQKPQPTVDVRQDATLAGVWGVNGDSNSRDESVVFGSMVNAGLLGYAGTVNLEKGGYDYHNGTRTTGDQRDGEAGAVIGRILESAAALNKKVFIYVTSDGAVVNAESDDRAAPWRSDRGSAGMAYILAYDPAGRPETSGHQIGQFTKAQAADDKFVTGNNPELAASAAVANYLQFNNRMDLITPVLGSTFSSAQLSQIIKFG